MNAILFGKDGTTQTFEDVRIDTYLDVPVYVPAPQLFQWKEGHIPTYMSGTYTKVRYVKQLESEDYAVFVEE